MANEEDKVTESKEDVRQCEVYSSLLASRLEGSVCW